MVNSPAKIKELHFPDMTSENRLLPPVYRLLSSVSRFLSTVSCLLSYRWLSSVSRFLSTVSRLLSHVFCLTSPVSRLLLLSPVSRRLPTPPAYIPALVSCLKSPVSRAVRAADLVVTI